jgi:two-component system response regulator
MTQRRVLLVEDDEGDRELALLAFRENDFRFPVDVAVDGAQALERLGGAQTLPDLVLLDLKLPKIGGLEVLKRVRAEPRLKGLLVVVLTGSDEPRDKTEAKRLGVAHYFIKPVGLRGFVEIIRELKVLLTEAP